MGPPLPHVRGQLERCFCVHVCALVSKEQVPLHLSSTMHMSDMTQHNLWVWGVSVLACQLKTTKDTHSTKLQLICACADAFV